MMDKIMNIVLKKIESMSEADAKAILVELIYSIYWGRKYCIRRMKETKKEMKSEDPVTASLARTSHFNNMLDNELYRRLVKDIYMHF